MTSSQLHVAVSGWLLGQPSGANRRLLAVVEHAAALLEPGERITVLYGRAAGHRPPADSEGVRWHAVPIAASPTLRRVFGERRHLAATLAAIGANVLDHGFLPLPRTGVKTCLLLHDLRAAEGLTRWPRGLARRTLARSCARAAAIVVPSEFTAARLRALVPGSAPTVIGNGVLPHEAAANAEGDYVLHVGHLEARKNLAVVVRALALLPASERPALALVGREAGAGFALRRLARELGVDARFLGALTDDDLPGLFTGARAIVVPSRYEGFGLAALEGLAAGRPTLVADAGALPEVVGDAGVVLPTDDSQAWADAIRGAADPGTQSPSDRRARAAEFTWRRAAERTVALWRQLAATSAPIAPRS